MILAMSAVNTASNFPYTRLHSLEEYLKARDDLIKAERDQGFDGSAQQTPLEAAAGEVVRKLKAWEENNLYGVDSEGNGYEAGHKFMHGLDSIAKSSLLSIAQRAPKGALLHCHFDAILPPETILADARGQERLYIKSDMPLTTDASFAQALPEFTVLHEDVALTETTNLFSRGYAAGSWMRYSTFRAMFPDGAGRAEEWISSRIVLQADDAYHPQQTVDGIWQSFIRAVTVVRGLLGYETAYREQFRRIIWRFAQDGISYAEIRVALDYGFSITSDDGSREYDQREIVQIFASVLEVELPKMKEKGLTFYGVKIIYACMRNSSREGMKWCMDKCIELKQVFPDLICGFDMQGQEDSGHPLSYWIPEILAMRAKCDELGLDLPFIFHAGETLDHGGDTDSNLYDAILLGTKRIGHGFSITRHPLLMQICRERNIAIETCPISNEVLGLCPSTRSHHLPVLLANRVPCSVNSDDPGCWGSSVLSHDFYQALMGSNNMSLLGWRVLGQWSIEHSCMDSDIRTKASQDFNDGWARFCQWILDTYGARAPDNATL